MVSGVGVAVVAVGAGRADGAGGGAGPTGGAPVVRVTFQIAPVLGGNS